MTMITPSYLGETIEYSSLHACRSTLEDPTGLRRDFKAVIGAVETSWSNGQTEGQINRLKAIKRQMYGRAGFHLLRARVLPYQGMAP